jgi:hypothetical protein
MEHLIDEDGANTINAETANEEFDEIELATNNETVY